MGIARRHWFLIACSIGAAAFAWPAAARTLTVCPKEGSGCRFVGGAGVQAAVDAARSGDVVRLKAGTYYPYRFRDMPFQDLQIRGFVVVDRKEIDIVGEPGAILDGARGYPTCAILLHKSRVRVRGLSIRGFRAALTEDKIYDGHGVFVIDSTAQLDDVEIATFRKMALSIRGASTVAAHGLHIHDGHVGVWIEEAAHLALSNSVIENNDSAAVAAYGVSTVTVANATFKANKDDGVYAEDSATIDVLNTVLARNAPFAARAVKLGNISVRRSLLHANERDAYEGEDAGAVAFDKIVNGKPSTRSDIGAGGGTKGLYTVVRRFAGADGGYDYASFDPALGRLFVAREDGVMAIDVDKGNVTAKLVSGNNVSAVLLLPNGEDMLATNWGGGNATLFDRRNGKVKSIIPTGEGPDGALFDAASGLALVMNTKSENTTLIDTAKATAVGTIPLPGHPEAAAADGKGRVFVNIEDKAEIAVIDMRTRAVVGAYPLAGCEEPTGLAYDAGSRQLLAACRNGVLKLVDAERGADRGTIVIGKGADGVVLDPKTKRVFIPCKDGTLTVLTLTAGRAAVADVILTQRGARTLAIDPQTGRLFLPAAQYRTGEHDEDKQVPGTFGVIVLEAK